MTAIRSMPTPPRLAIVTPSYNQAEYLEECIDSVLSQGYPNLEYVVMDGGSTDGSVEIIKRYEAHLTYWQSCPDGGQYAAINAGFARTTGDIMAWLNSDDRYHPNAFLKIATVFSEYKETDWVTGFRSIWGKDGKILMLERGITNFSRRKYLTGGFGKPCIQQESTFWRRSLWEKAGGFLNTACTLAADAELWLRFFRHAELYRLKALIGGFRLYGEQRSLVDNERYVFEIEHEISKELLALPPDTKFNPMPQPLYIPPEIYLKYAEDFSMPRFTVEGNSLWQNYVHSITQWIYERIGGLETASLFFDEVSLWDYEVDNLASTLIKQLNYQLAEVAAATKKLEQGEISYRAGEIDAAVKANSEALALWPTSAAGINNQGILLYLTGEIEESIKCLIRATQCDPCMREVYRNLAIVFYETGQRHKMLLVIDGYLSQFPDDREMEQFFARLTAWP